MEAGVGRGNKKRWEEWKEGSQSKDGESEAKEGKCMDRIEPIINICHMCISQCYISSNDTLTLLLADVDPNNTSKGYVGTPARFMTVKVKGQQVKLKWCPTCNIWRPPRASHCGLCNNCYGEYRCTHGGC